MTRYLLAPFPLHGHVTPMVALAAELASRGHQVDVVISAPFAEVFREVGCTVTEIAIRPRGGVPEQPTFGHRLRRIRRIADVFREQRRLTRELVEGWPVWEPAVVVADIMAIWGIRAAEAAGVPFVSFHVTYAVSEEVLLDEVRQQLGPRAAALVRRLGIARIQPGLRRRVTAGAAKALVNTVPELQPARESFDERFHFVGPLRREPVGTDGSAAGYSDDLPWDRIADEPSVYVSTGTMFTRGPEFFRKIADAFAGTRWLVVLATSHTDPAELGTLPPNVIARQYVPQSAVLERCDAFLSHGGMNSALEGLALGRPMVLVPRAADQREIARRLAEAGVGVVVPAESEGQRFVTALDEVVADPDIRRTLDGLSSRMGRLNGPGAAAEVLEKLAAEGQHGPGRSR
ncbi:nucleotide disphospho-sugar-binding domain-containing protein [Streptomyces sp. NBC_01363]|uniref:nucleotide disphospho-sugar-binding domain-containing protein n=1 Tax=Streptomyces sp. NBC_01363 TaxID=2903840 RepID=UPI0022586176|nr:nucleotide disphospho-sugar-binding domain-containing protein [Streptomyces sp. NBC_01363]MCX4733362.1 glycosyltransferase [Streptomyces sp. NBC_01363]